MLILSNSGMVNLDNVFSFSINNPFKNIPAAARGSECYALTAYHSKLTGEDEEPDSVVLKWYATEQEARKDIERIFNAHLNGAAAVHL